MMITDICEPLCVCWELNELSSLEEQTVLLITSHLTSNPSPLFGLFLSHGICEQKFDFPPILLKGLIVLSLAEKLTFPSKCGVSHRGFEDALY